MKRLARFFRERHWVTRGHDADERPYFEAVVFFQAADMDEAERLQDAMLEAIGCSDEGCLGNKETPCPHFRFGSLKLMEDDE